MMVPVSTHLFTIILCLLHSVDARPQVRQGGLSLPLRSPSPERLRLSLSRRPHVISYTNTEPYHAARGRRQNTPSSPVFDWGDDALYYATVNVGTPPQYFNVTIIHQSSVVWVPSTPCCSSTAIPGAPSFNTSASTTWRNSTQWLSLPSTSVNISGWIGFETVSMGGYSVYNQSIGVITSGAGSAGVPYSVSGQLGLGWGSIGPNSPMGLAWWQNLLTYDEALEQPLFAIYLARQNIPYATAGAESGTGSSFDIGFLNSTLYTGSITYMPLNATSTSAINWQVPLESLSIEGVTIATGNVNAEVEMGTPFISVPGDVAATIYRSVPGAILDARDFSGYYRVSCSTNVTISFTIAGVTYPLNPVDFVIDIGNDECVGVIYPNDIGGPAQWVLGDAFLKNVYSVYRLSPPSIGFAKLAPEYENRGQWPASLDNFTQTQTQTRLSTVLDTFPTYAPTSTIGTRASSATLRTNTSRCWVSCVAVLFSVLCLSRVMC